MKGRPKFEIKNKFTGYCEAFSFAEKRNFDGELLIDTFYKFEPCDIDNDGIYEIRCCQYTSFFGHSDFVGTAVSFIKYDNVTSTFNVVDAYFELGDIV